MPDTVLRPSSGVDSHDESIAAIEALLRKELVGREEPGWEMPHILSRRQVERILRKLEKGGTIVDGKWMYEGSAVVFGTGTSEASMETPVEWLRNELMRTLAGATRPRQMHFKLQGDQTTPNVSLKSRRSTEC